MTKENIKRTDEINKLREEIVKVQMAISLRKEKNVRKARNLRRELARRLIEQSKINASK